MSGFDYLIEYLFIRDKKIFIRFLVNINLRAAIYAYAYLTNINFS